MIERVLVAVDESAASHKALHYVGRLFRDVPRKPTLVLLTVVPLPPASLRSAPSATTAGPLALDPEFDAAHDVHAFAECEALPVLEEATRLLRPYGFDESNVEHVWYVDRRKKDLAAEILEVARQRDCETLVVGRQALPWYRELVHVHVSDRLARIATARTVWVVECQWKEQPRPRTGVPSGATAGQPNGSGT